MSQELLSTEDLKKLRNNLINLKFNMSSELGIDGVNYLDKKISMLDIDIENNCGRQIIHI